MEKNRCGGRGAGGGGGGGGGGGQGRDLTIELRHEAVCCGGCSPGGLQADAEWAQPSCRWCSPGPFSEAEGFAEGKPGNCGLVDQLGRAVREMMS